MGEPIVQYDTVEDALDYSTEEHNGLEWCSEHTPCGGLQRHDESRERKPGENHERAKPLKFNSRQREQQQSDEGHEEPEPY